MSQLSEEEELLLQELKEKHQDAELSREELLERQLIKILEQKRSLEEELRIERTRVDTFKHKQQVSLYLFKLIKIMLKRAREHDLSKLESPEVELFAKVNHNLPNLTYGSDEYQASLDTLKPALEHHYAHNSHHPEHYKDGIADMNLVDLIEFFCDLKASSERQHGGNLRKTLEEVGERFNMDSMLIKILENSLTLLVE